MKSVLAVYLSSDISSIGRYAFAGCTRLKNVFLTTNGDWKYERTGYYPDQGTVSKSVMNDSGALSEKLKKYSSDYYWRKV